MPEACSPLASAIFCFNAKPVAESGICTFPDHFFPKDRVTFNTTGCASMLPQCIIKRKLLCSQPYYEFFLSEIMQRHLQEKLESKATWRPCWWSLRSLVSQSPFPVLLARDPYVLIWSLFAKFWRSCPRTTQGAVVQGPVQYMSFAGLFRDSQPTSK